MTSDNELVDAVILETGDKMDKAVEHAQVEFASIRTGRASPAFVEKLTDTRRTTKGIGVLVVSGAGVNDPRPPTLPLRKEEMGAQAFGLGESGPISYKFS